MIGEDANIQICVPIFAKITNVRYCLDKYDNKLSTYKRSTNALQAYLDTL